MNCRPMQMEMAENLMKSLLNPHCSEVQCRWPLTEILDSAENLLRSQILPLQMPRLSLNGTFNLSVQPSSLIPSLEELSV